MVGRSFIICKYFFHITLLVYHRFDRMTSWQRASIFSRFIIIRDSGRDEYLGVVNGSCMLEIIFYIIDRIKNRTDIFSRLEIVWKYKFILLSIFKIYLYIKDFRNINFVISFYLFKHRFEISFQNLIFLCLEILRIIVTYKQFVNNFS